MNVWTIHERSATWKTNDKNKVSVLMELVSLGWVTVPNIELVDGIWTAEVYVPPNNNFHRTLNLVRKELI